VLAIERTAPGYTRHLTARVRETLIPNTLRLLDAFHRLRRPVYFTAFASATGDGRDVTTAPIRYRDAERRGTGQSVILTRSDPATNVIPELSLRPGDRVLTKTSMESSPRPGWPRSYGWEGSGPWPSPGC
jgi:nicotinamidase-related amidase